MEINAQILLFPFFSLPGLGGTNPTWIVYEGLA